MVKQGIKIFCRIKPTKAKTGLFEIDDDESGFPTLSFVVPRELASGFINNKKEEYVFRFDCLFDQYTKQDEVFDNVARDVVDNCLLGYNGTIFAYGQTSSGKTFTITGGPERFIDRGIIPRILTYLFEEYTKSPGNVFSTHVSYLEIYNESGYDLLDPKHEAAKLEDLPKVALMEDSDGCIHLKNLSIHQANNEEEALNLLFLGDTNRMIAETPMNQASTRSHCIFTIHLSIREVGSATIRRSKLHLVDLAGSERVGKTGVEGNLLKEAKYINLSLHYLEQVIVSLSEKSRSHIPYRNSMMTSVLRDSLGGNCMTSMIATCSVDKKNIDESISTCRFAQRVALIKNNALLNEELDPKLLIARLKAEVQELKNQLSLATGEQTTDELTEEDRERLSEVVDQYVQDSDPEATLNVGADMRKINECFRIFKRLAQGKGFASGGSSQPRQQEERQGREEPTPPGAELPAVNHTKLEELLKQRDNEINILVNMLKKEKKRANEALSQVQTSGAKTTPNLSASSSSANQATQNGYHVNIPPSGTIDQSGEPCMPYGQEKDQSNDMNRSHDRARHAVDQSEGSDRSGDTTRRKNESVTSYRLKDSKRKLLGDMTVGRQEAFEIFRRDYPQNATIEDHKLQLRRRYAEAKNKGQFVNVCRQNINQLKSQIEHRRLQLAMSTDRNPNVADDVEQSLRQRTKTEKSNYKETFNELRSLKAEIEHLQHFLEKSRLQLQRDFELWWAEQEAVIQKQQPSLPQPRPPSMPPSNPSKAWKTPPLSPLKDQRTESLRGSSGSDSVLPHAGPTRNALLGALPTHSADRSASRHHAVPPLASPSPTGGVTRELEQRAGSNWTKPESLSQSTVQLTGDKRADADIMAFIKARQNLLQTRGQVPR